MSEIFFSTLYILGAPGGTPEKNFIKNGFRGPQMVQLKFTNPIWTMFMR